MKFLVFLISIVLTGIFALLDLPILTLIFSLINIGSLVWILWRFILYFIIFQVGYIILGVAIITFTDLGEWVLVALVGINIVLTIILFIYSVFFADSESYSYSMSDEDKGLNRITMYLAEIRDKMSQK